MDPIRIYLQPECCADSDTGRLWCEDPDPEECENSQQWVRYYNGKEVERALSEEMKEWTGDHKKAVRTAMQGVFARLDTIYK